MANGPNALHNQRLPKLQCGILKIRTVSRMTPIMYLWKWEEMGAVVRRDEQALHECELFSLFA
jgi:hypothetical protein